MNIQPLRAVHLAAAQRAAQALFPWEQEHQEALAVAVNPLGQPEFLAARGLSSVRGWTSHDATGDVNGLAALYQYAAQPDEVWLAWFGLLPHARGDGRGARLLDWLIQLSRREGNRTLRLWTTDEPEYATALALYRRRGFRPEPCPALPGESWQTLVFSLSLDGNSVRAWTELPGRGELCGREAPRVAAAA